MRNAKCEVQNEGMLRVDYTSGKLQVASGKLRVCDALYFGAFRAPKLATFHFQLSTLMKEV